MWLAAFLWAAGFCIGGFIFFWRAEERYGRT
jgi:teichoic acid transport system permease protein